MEEATFSISKQFVVDSVVNCYKGDNSFSNPLKMFIENEAFDREIALQILKTSSEPIRRIFLMELWMQPTARDLWVSVNDGRGHKVREDFVDIAKQSFQYTPLEMIRYRDKLLKTFQESDLSQNDFEWLVPYDEMIRISKQVGQNGYGGAYPMEEKLIYFVAPHPNYEHQVEVSQLLKRDDIISEAVKEAFIF